MVRVGISPEADPNLTRCELNTHSLTFYSFYHYQLAKSKCAVFIGVM